MPPHYFINETNPAKRARRRNVTSFRGVILRHTRESDPAAFRTQVRLVPLGDSYTGSGGFEEPVQRSSMAPT